MAGVRKDRRKPKPEGWMPHDKGYYCVKPKMKNLRIVRCCLTCQKNFTAPSKYVRICTPCTRSDLFTGDTVYV